MASCGGSTPVCYTIHRGPVVQFQNLEGPEYHDEVKDDSSDTEREDSDVDNTAGQTHDGGNGEGDDFGPDTERKHAPTDDVGLMAAHQRRELVDAVERESQ